jgi:hypothetical protein
MYMTFLDSIFCSSRHMLYAFGIVVLLTLGLSVGAADAQRASGNIGLGGQIGSPSGVTVKLYNAGGPSYDFLAAWDLDEFFFLNAHAQFSDPIRANNVSGLEWFAGPGAFIGVDDDEAALGISGRIGINWMANEYVEFFGHVTPRLSLAPDTDGGFGGGLGLRYYF